MTSHTIELMLTRFAILGPVGHSATSLMHFANLPASMRPLLSVIDVFVLAWVLGWLCVIVATGTGIFTVLIRRRSRSTLPRQLVLFALACASLLVAWWIASFRVEALNRVATNAEPLVQAIEGFALTRGEIPSALSELVPASIAVIPETGCVSFPIYSYSKATSQSPFSRYELAVPMTQIPLSFDRFIFWPEGEYPDQLYGGRVKRIGRWAYISE